jgi:hypothetical protein
MLYMRKQSAHQDESWCSSHLKVRWRKKDKDGQVATE